MATATALAVFLAVAVFFREMRQRKAKQQFRAAFRYDPLFVNARRVDRDLCATAFALTTWLEVENDLHARVGDTTFGSDPSYEELMAARQKIMFYEHEFWLKFRAAEDCGMPLRYVIFHRSFGVTIAFGRRAAIRDDCTPDDSFREGVEVYANIHLPVAFAFNREIARLLQTTS